MKHVKHSCHMVVIVLTTNMVSHVGWYSFEGFSHATGLDPALIATVLSGPIGIPIAIVCLVTVDRVEDRSRKAIERDGNLIVHHRKQDPLTKGWEASK